MKQTGDDARLQEFARRIDAIRARVEADLGAKDAAYIRRVRRFSVAMEITGRALIHVSLDPVTFSAGVVALWLHKQLEATEIGHTALHGAFDRLPGCDDLAARGFRWKTPIDEEAWHQGHNIRHHQYTNIAGRDPDIRYGGIRLNRRTPHKRHHRWQPLMTAVSWSHFAAGMNLRFTGAEEVLSRDEPYDFLPDRSPASVRAAWRRALRKFVPYYARELVLFPALAGPGFAKVALGNWLSEVMRDVYSAATIFCGHVGEQVADYPAGTRAGGRGQWYRMQVEASNDFEVPLPVSMLCGALDRQIEHHLFPRFPTNRLREIAPEVRQACADCGVSYRTDSWPRTLARALKRIWELRLPDPPPAGVPLQAGAAEDAQPQAGAAGLVAEPHEALVAAG
ncbi:MAG TPA: fatty acid desaturase [Kofleriaceae bacterium]|jgi:linoleoyl-CoA desaturase|nr:fatty acid desaturase [Kofleriaceae bacterium]